MARGTRFFDTVSSPHDYLLGESLCLKIPKCAEMMNVVDCGLRDIGRIASTFAASSHEACLADIADMCGGGMLLHPILIIGAARQTSVHALREQNAVVALNSAYFIVGLSFDRVCREFSARIRATYAPRNDLCGCDRLVPFGGPADAPTGSEGYRGPRRVIR